MLVIDAKNERVAGWYASLCQLWRCAAAGCAIVSAITAHDNRGCAKKSRKVLDLVIGAINNPHPSFSDLRHDTAMTEYLTDHEASLPAIVLGCVAEISQSVPASIGKGIPGQKADLNEAAGAADAAAGSPPEGRIRPMYLRWGAAQESLQWRPTPSRRRGTKGRPLATDGLSRSRMGTKTS